MKKISFLLLLVSGLAFGQITQFVTRQEFYTRAAVTLFVGPTGNDSNPCTATGAAACLTFNGALSKVPKRVRHNVTITSAAGSWTETITMNGFTLSSELGNVTITLTGPALVAFTPATGTASGTLTNVAGLGSGAFAQRVTDNTQSWTVNDLRGRFFTVAGVSRPIIANTATTIDVARTSAFTIGNTYTIDTPATSITGAGGLQGLIIQGLSGTGSVVVNNLSITGGQAVSISTATLTPAVNFTNDRILGVASTGFSVSGVQTAVTRTYMTANGTTLPAIVCSGKAQCTVSEDYAHSAATAASFQPTVAVNAGASFIGASVFENTSSTGHVMEFLPINGQVSSGQPRGRFVCASGSAGAAIHVSSGTMSGLQYDIVAHPVRFQNGFSISPTSLDVENCAIGFRGYGDVWVTNNNTGATAWYFNNVTTAFDLAYGARVIFGASATFTFTGVTNQFLLDGTAKTLVQLDAAGPPALLSTGYFTLIAR